MVPGTVTMLQSGTNQLGEIALGYQLPIQKPGDVLPGTRKSVE